MVRKKGFTLVELLFVIAIIGIILALLAPALLIVKRRALAINCVSQLRGVSQTVQIYFRENDDVIPYVAMGPEAQSHPQHYCNPATGVPSLSHFLDDRQTPAEVACCPADTGCAGQSYYPTTAGMSCYEDWGQSMLYNSSCYREEGAPGYDDYFDGPMFGAKPVTVNTIPSHPQYLLAADFWGHWHFGASSSASESPFYTNILFFDGHVDGRHYSSQRQALAYLDWDGIRRWWVKNPAPFQFANEDLPAGPGEGPIFSSASLDW